MWTVYKMACFLTLLPFFLRWWPFLKSCCDSLLLPCTEFQGSASDSVLRRLGGPVFWTRLTCPSWCNDRCYGPDSVENCLEVCSCCSSTRSSCVQEDRHGLVVLKTREISQLQCIKQGAVCRDAESYPRGADGANETVQKTVEFTWMKFSLVSSSSWTRLLTCPRCARGRGPCCVGHRQGFDVPVIMQRQVQGRLAICGGTGGWWYFGGIDVFFRTPSCWTLSPCSQVIFWESSRARVAQLAGTLLTSTLLLCGRVRNNNNNTIWRGPESRSLPSRWPNPIPAIPPYVVKTPHLHGPRSKHLFF